MNENEGRAGFQRPIENLELPGVVDEPVRKEGGQDLVADRAEEAAAGAQLGSILQISFGRNLRIKVKL
jgi:hypothetical protein